MFAEAAEKAATMLAEAALSITQLQTFGTVPVAALRADTLIRIVSVEAEMDYTPRQEEVDNLGTPELLVLATLARSCERLRRICLSDAFNLTPTVARAFLELLESNSTLQELDLAGASLYGACTFTLWGDSRLPRGKVERPQLEAQLLGALGRTQRVLNAPRPM